MPADKDLSYVAGMLWPVTLADGISIGDRYCLALAARTSLPTLTAERRWPEIAEAAGARVEVVRPARG